MAYVWNDHWNLEWMVCLHGLGTFGWIAWSDFDGIVWWLVLWGFNGRTVWMVWYDELDFDTRLCLDCEILLMKGKPSQIPTFCMVFRVCTNMHMVEELSLGLITLGRSYHWFAIMMGLFEVDVRHWVPTLCMYHTFIIRDPGDFVLTGLWSRASLPQLTCSMGRQRHNFI